MLCRAIRSLKLFRRPSGFFPSMKSIMRGFAVLCLPALLCLCVPLKADSFKILYFSGFVSQVDLFYDPQGTLYKPPVAPVSVGDPLTGQLSFSVLDFPTFTLRNYGLHGTSGNWSSGFSKPGIFIGGGQLSLTVDAAQQFVSINLIDPAGGTNWQAGTFSASERSGYPFSWWRFEATLTSIPDGGYSAAMLGGVLAVLTLIHRRKSPGLPGL